MNTTVFSHWVMYLLLLSIVLSLFFIIAMSIILFMDSLCRPNVPQIPFNTVLDRIIPFVILIMPLIIIIWYKPFETWFTRLLLLIGFHILVLIPLFHYWSQLRNWQMNVVGVSYKSWNHPRLYKNIALALIYPLFWGLYGSCSRFLRLGQTYDVVNNISQISADNIIILFISPYIMIWLFLISSAIIKVKKYLWNEVYVLLYSTHIFLLQFYGYFKIMEMLFKSSFCVEQLLTLNINYKQRNISWWKKMINYFFYYPKWVVILIFSFIVMEIMVTKQLYYGLYILFFFPIIHNIFSCYIAFGYTEFVFDCCFCDYISQRDKFQTPRYPINFWNYFRDAEYYFGFEYDYTPEQTNQIAIEMQKRKSTWLLRKNVSYDKHQDLLNVRLLSRKNAPNGLRMAANFQHVNRVRWVHTARVLNTAKKLHSCTALFVKTIYDNIALLNSAWSHMHHIQAARLPMYYPENMYINNKPILYPLKKLSFIQIQENNLSSNFTIMTKKNVMITPYNGDSQDQPVYKPQANPDIIFNFTNSDFIDKRIHSMDQKTNNPGLGDNKILSEITTQRYH